MGRKRGFFAELQHQQRLAEQREARRRREQAAHERQREQAQRRAERARQQAARAAETDRKRAAAEAARLHVEAMEAEVASRNAELASIYEEIDGMLEATLAVDDHVDLETLRVTVEHPPFPRPDLQQPVPPPPPISVAPEPHFLPPPPPTGTDAWFGGRKRHAETVATAEQAYRREHDRWLADVAIIPERRRAQDEAHRTAVDARLAQLASVDATYQQECRVRAAEVQEANGRLDALIAGLARGEGPALEEYVGIVLGSSVYPDAFPVEHEDFTFSPADGELVLTISIPPPDRVPATKAHRYQKNIDQIVSSPLSLKAQRDRYAGAVHQVALRTLHEVFEADRAGHVRTISLEVVDVGDDPATGLPRRVTLVAVAAEREQLLRLDLAKVVPAATLDHLRASVSKNPFGLVGVGSAGRDVRTR
jgi:restriction system protein